MYKHGVASNRTTEPARVVAQVEYTVDVRTLRAEMARNGYTVNSLAPRIGLTQTSLWRRMSGLAPFKLPEIIAMAAHLYLAVETLLGVTAGDYRAVLRQLPAAA